MYNLVLAKNGAERRIKTGISYNEATLFINEHPNHGLQAYISGSESAYFGLQYICNDLYLINRA